MPRFLLLCLLITACQPRPAGPDASKDASKKEISVFILTISTDQVGFFEWAEAAYEAAHPDIDIQIEQFPGSSLKDYEIKLRLRYASGNAPDIWYFRENELAEYVELGLLAEAPAYIEKIVQENSVNDMIREAPYFNGRCYGIVHHAGWTMLYYNKAHFREAGLDHPPKDWTEMLEFGDQLTRRDAAGNVTRAGISLRKTGYKQVRQRNG